MIGLPAQVVIPNFGGGGGSSTCLSENHLFCWSWVRQNWSGTLLPALEQHIVLTLIAVLAGFAISMALALLAHRRGWLERPITWTSELLYTIPSLALFQILVPIFGLGSTAPEIALVSYTLLILFRNILTGLRAVPSEVRDAARGMGLTRRQILWKVELPLAVPAIMAGLRIATVTVISLATIAAYISNKGLGTPIFAAIGNGTFKTELIAAGVLAIALALVGDGLLAGIQRMLTPWIRARRA
ncbi:MAG: ABC transporter permease [Thermoleophilaceae bacterium]